MGFDYNDLLLNSEFAEAFQLEINKIIKQNVTYQEKMAFDQAVLERKLAEWKTVLICNRDMKYKLEQATHDLPVVIIGSPVVPEDKVYELTDTELKMSLLYDKPYLNFKPLAFEYKE